MLSPDHKAGYFLRGGGRLTSHYTWILCDILSHRIHVCYIYLHEWLISMVFTIHGM